ncbi:barstar family protein [Kineococcus xinjiangensis]|uniref:barstar family protein n=1 Tax=Kineococcus xinjiangensis TaxID=512762 RepID=UPI001304F0A3|nr:barstar family protein [Kineococcus xinjiangensis]
MAAFDSSAFMTRGFDFELALAGPVVLFHRAALLYRARQLLVEAGYDLITVDASRWDNESVAHQELASALHFPDYYGANLDALNDCLSDLASYNGMTSPAAAGFVLVVKHLEVLVQRMERFAYGLLSAYAQQARGAALIGHRMLCLAQTDDPDLHLAPLDTVEAAWNDAERFLPSRRGGAGRDH